MAAALDPTYPLYPIACILAAAMLLLVLLTSFIRQNWNLGVAFLCFWLFWENLAGGVNAIIWSDNADVKFYTYCDIVSYVQLAASIVKPMATLIITRRLYLITSLRSVELSDKAAKRKNLAIEWVLGLVLPVLVAGPFYYIVQQVRFAVYGGFGCMNSPDISLLGILLIYSLAVIPPLLSITIYYPRVIWTFYRQRRDMNRFLQSNNSVSPTNYFRIFALASIDVILTLPISIVSIVIRVAESLVVLGHFPIYSGWTFLHTNWEPVGVPYDEVVADGASATVEYYFTVWTSPIVAFAIFGLFGVTAEARASYRRAICTVGGWFGCKPSVRARKARSPVGTMEFGKRPQDMSFNLDIESQPSYSDTNARAPEQGAENEGGRAPTRGFKSDSHLEITEEALAISDDTGAPDDYDTTKPVETSDAV